MWRVRFATALVEYHWDKGLFGHRAKCRAFAAFERDRLYQGKWQSPSVCVPVIVVIFAQRCDGIDEQKFTGTTTR
ncbi:hypothetical protein ASD42_29470 [Nocardia sp. Root136]|nr:hypothetical protein ASD42_29470 [Nocardia sp. Root136]